MTRLYAYGLAALLLLGAIGAIYAKGRIDAAHKAEVEQLRLDLREATQAIELERNARRNDAILAAENAQRRAALKKQISELDAYVESLEGRDAVCLDGDDTHILRQLWHP